MELTIDGAAIAFDDADAGTTILLIHAGIADRSMWRQQVVEFSESYRVVTCDLQGFGKSGQSEDTFSYSDDIRSLLDELGIDQAVVVGISFGGNVALDFAVSFPECVLGLVLVSPLAAMTEPSEELATVWLESDAAFEAGNIDRAVALEMAAWIDGGRMKERIDADFRSEAEAMIRKIWKRALLAEPTGQERELYPSASKRLNEIKSPVMLVWGDHELPAVPVSMRRLAHGILQAKSHLIADWSHLAPLERPVEFNRQL